MSPSRPAAAMLALAVLGGGCAEVRAQQRQDLGLAEWVAVALCHLRGTSTCGNDDDPMLVFVTSSAEKGLVQLKGGVHVAECGAESIRFVTAGADLWQQEKYSIPVPSVRVEVEPGAARILANWRTGRDSFALCGRLALDCRWVGGRVACEDCGQSASRAVALRGRCVPCTHFKKGLPRVVLPMSPRR